MPVLTIPHRRARLQRQLGRRSRNHQGITLEEIEGSTSQSEDAVTQTAWSLVSANSLD